MTTLDSISPLDLITIERAAQAAALRGDTLHSQLDHLLPVSGESAVKADGFLAFLSTSWGFPTFCAVMVLIALLLGWALKNAQARTILDAEAMKVKEAVRLLEIEQFRARHEHLLMLLRKRDRYMIQYEAVSLLSEQQFTDWDRATWKDIARNQLALSLAVRPLVYADYRSRIRGLSPTYRNLPGPALQAWQQSHLLPVPAGELLVDLVAQEPNELDWLFPEKEAVVAQELSELELLFLGDGTAPENTAENVIDFIARIQRENHNYNPDFEA